MAKSSKFGVKFDGFTEMAARLDKLGGDLHKATEKALEFIPEEINPELHKAMAPHHRTGKTEGSIVEEKVTWEGTKATIRVGFDISHNGLPSIFLMYGTPRHAPGNQYGKGSGTNPGIKQDKKLFDAIYGSRIQKQIAEKQEEKFMDEIQKAMK